MKTWFIYFLVMIIYAECNSQTVTESKTLKYNINSKDYSITSLTVSNIMNEPFMIWFHSPDKTLDIKRYFSKRKEDFSLSTLLYEGLLKGTNMTVGQDFLKILPSGSKFMIFILSDTTIVKNSFEDYVAVVKQSQVQSIYNFNLKLINGYEEDYIILYASDLLNLKN